MKCPHCLTAFHSDLQWLQLGEDREYVWRLGKQVCPECSNLIVVGEGVIKPLGRDRKLFPWHPRAIGRAPASKEVPEEYTSDYQEASLVLADSPKASAALSRRCLQRVLREKAGVNPGNLADEIQEVLDQGKLPSHLLQSLDAVRNIGNFAAHPIKSRSTGEVLDVEPGEADWNLDVLESSFDYFFVQPAILKQKRDALNQKLQDAGKPPMK